MKVCKISIQSLHKIKLEWDNYHNRCISELDSQLADDLESARREAAEDLRYERYSEESINSWLSNQESELRSSASDFRNIVYKEYVEGVKLLSKLEKVKFTEKDSYYFTINMHNATTHSTPTNSGVSVQINGMYREIGDVRLDFSPSSLSFTDWYEEESNNDNYR